MTEWLEGWQYRKSHNLTGASGAGTNYQMRVKVNRTTGEDSGENVYVGTKCREDFGDIRFTDDDETTLLDYWLESIVGTVATFWVEVQDNLDSNQIIYVYYGKADATTTSNIVTTGIFGDDFEDGSVSDWTGSGGGSISADTEFKRSGSYSLKITDTSTSAYCRALTPTFTAQTQKCSLIYYQRVPVTTKSGTQKINAPDDPDQFMLGQESNGYWRYYNGAWVNIQTYSAGVWYKAEIIYDVNADKVLEILIDDVSKVTDKAFKVTIASITNFSWYGVGATQTGSFNVDDIFLRKYVSPEPAHGSWGSEEEEAVGQPYISRVQHVAGMRTW